VWRARFDPGPAHMRFVVDKEALGQDFFEYFHSSSSNIIPPMFHTHLFLRAAFTRTNGCSLGTFKKQCSFRNQEQWIDKYFHFLVFNGLKYLEYHQRQQSHIPSYNSSTIKS
jgi:hypothetical protein